MNAPITTPLLPDPDTELGEPLAHKMRKAMIGLGVLVVGIGGAMALIPMGGAVIGSGEVIVESQTKRIAHPIGGTVAELYVRDGDQVEQGDPLIKLDDEVSYIDAQLSSLSVDQMLAQRARLEAERMGSDTIRFPAELTESRTPSAAMAMREERRLFDIRRSESSGRVRQMRARLEQLGQEIKGYNAQIAAYREQLNLIEPELKSIRELWDEGLVTISRLNQLERAAIEIKGNIASSTASIASTQARITETQEQIIQIGENRRSEAGSELTALNATLNQQQVRSASADDKQERSLIVAPQSGRVDKLAITSIGEVIKPADTIAEIVPDSDRLIVEARISPTDIDQVRQGQHARIRFSAFSAQTTPEYPAEVTRVAPNSTTDPRTGTSYYSVKILIDGAALKRDPVELVPGMPVESYIETGSRSMLSYILKPLRDQFARAFTDG